MKVYKTYIITKSLLLSVFLTFSLSASSPKRQLSIDENFESSSTSIDIPPSPLSCSVSGNFEAVKSSDITAKKNGLYFFKELDKKKSRNKEFSLAAAYYCIYEKNTSLRLLSLDILKGLVDNAYPEAIDFIMTNNIVLFQNEKESLEEYVQKLHLAKSLVLQGVVPTYFTQIALDAIHKNDEWSKILGIYLLIGLVDKKQVLEETKNIISRLVEPFEEEKYGVQQAVIDLSISLLKHEETKMTIVDLLNQEKISQKYKRQVSIPLKK